MDKLDIQKLEEMIDEQTRNGRDSVYIDKDVMAELTNNSDFKEYTSKKVFVGENVIKGYINVYKQKHNII